MGGQHDEPSRYDYVVCGRRAAASSMWGGRGWGEGEALLAAM